MKIEMEQVKQEVVDRKTMNLSQILNHVADLVEKENVKDSDIKAIILDVLWCKGENSEKRTSGVITGREDELGFLLMSILDKVKNSIRLNEEHRANKNKSSMN